MSCGLRAASDHLPGQSRQLAELFKRDDDFRSLCDDLWAADAALARVDTLAAPLQAARRVEYQDLIAALIREIENALDRAKIVPLGKK